MCVCVYMSIHSLHIVVVIQLSYEWPHYFYSVTFHIWQLNSGKGKEHSVNDCPPPCDGWPHALPWQKSPASYCAAYSSTHRYTQKRTTDTRINLFKKKNHSLLQSPENPTKPYVQLFTEKRGMERLRKPAEMLNSNHFTDSLMPLFWINLNL